MPARESTAALLLLLLVGDVLAVSIYRHDCDWSLLRHLVPAVLPGLVLGSVAVALVDDSTMRIGLGIVLLLLVLAQLLSRRVTQDDEQVGWSRWSTRGIGVAAGFTTMVANAAGPVMTLYLVAQGVDKRRFLGTAAWFFFGVNLSKLPFSVGLGLIHTDMLLSTAILAPAVLLGGVVGLLVVTRLRQGSFDAAVLLASLVSAGALLIR
jgi:uncharacterized membrane protein YfcA